MSGAGLFKKLECCSCAGKGTTDLKCVLLGSVTSVDLRVSQTDKWLTEVDIASVDCIQVSIIVKSKDLQAITGECDVLAATTQNSRAHLLQQIPRSLTMWTAG